MTKNHEHAGCKHEKMAFCQHCQAAYCENCGREWADCKLNHFANHGVWPALPMQRPYWTNQPWGQTSGGASSGARGIVYNAHNHTPGFGNGLAVG